MKIVTEHLTRVHAYVAKRRYERIQLEASLEIEHSVPGEPWRKKLRELDIEASSALIVRKEGHRRYKWAVMALA